MLVYLLAVIMYNNSLYTASIPTTTRLERIVRRSCKPRDFILVPGVRLLERLLFQPLPS